MSDKKVDISVRFGYTYKHKRDSSIRGDRGRNCPRIQTVSGFGSVLRKNRVWVNGHAGLSNF